MTITIPEVSPATVGKLIALFERAVGLYASLIGINAYHQPGVQAGKQAADAVLEVQAKAVHHVRSNPAQAYSLEELAQAIGEDSEIETLFAILRHLAANGDVQHQPGSGEAAEGEQEQLTPTKPCGRMRPVEFCLPCPPFS